MAMTPDTPVDASSQHHSIVYCPSCGASASLPVVPPSNAGLFCDICTSTNLFVSTDGGDWNPLSDAFNALSLSSSDQPQQIEAASVPAANNTPQIVQHLSEDLPIQSPTTTIQDEMKRRSVILSELINFREALYQHHIDPQEGSGAEAAGGGMGEVGGEEDSNMESNLDVIQPDHFSNIARTYNDLLHLRQQSGMFLMDEVDTMDESGGYVHQNNMYHNGLYHQQQLDEEVQEGMYDDPPQEYVNAHPPVQETDQAWYGAHPTATATPAQGQQKEEPEPHLNHPTNSTVLEDDEDEDDDEGQVYATPEQREEMKRRRSELHQDKELRAREQFWRKYGIGSLGTGH
ncbi:hypothetical protein TWF481_003696 [Arthrobotrys musiformis]|uniref:Uncharacterized protein n=1 Tax=Arthrobotrys musiformis TaxID=47236 RepID=A0AAV9WHG7_9PEZI